MDLQAVREELATYAPEGWTSYSSIPGAAETPCMVVGMPESITYDGSFKMARVVLPVLVSTGPLYDADAEARLMEGALAIAAAYRAVRSGTNFKSCTVQAIQDFSSDTNGGNSVYSAVVSLNLLINL